MSRAVFLHGFGADRLSWLGSVSALTEVDCVTPDLPGHGTAVDALEDGTLEDLATGVLTRLPDGPPAWLVGHSLGGGVAMWLAANHPERWRGLVLFAPLGLGKDIDHARLQGYPDIADEDEMMAYSGKPCATQASDKKRIRRLCARPAECGWRAHGASQDH